MHGHTNVKKVRYQIFLFEILKGFKKISKINVTVESRDLNVQQQVSHVHQQRVKQRERQDICKKLDIVLAQGNGNILHRVLNDEPRRALTLIYPGMLFHSKRRSSKTALNELWNAMSKEGFRSKS
jgi:hypothetical protein